jgi:hypothetical protein
MKETQMECYVYFTSCKLARFFDVTVNQTTCIELLAEGSDVMDRPYS